MSRRNLGRNGREGCVKSEGLGQAVTVVDALGVQGKAGEGVEGTQFPATLLLKSDVRHRQAKYR
jgi:hypothetical protein